MFPLLLLLVAFPLLQIEPLPSPLAITITHSRFCPTLDMSKLRASIEASPFVIFKVVTNDTVMMKVNLV